MRILWQLELFALNPMHKMQFSKKIFGDSDKKNVFLQQQIPPRLSTMRTTVGLRFLYGYMNYANLYSRLSKILRFLSEPR